MADTKMIQNIVANAENNSYEFDLVGEKVAEVNRFNVVNATKADIVITDATDVQLASFSADDFETYEEDGGTYGRIKEDKQTVDFSTATAPIHVTVSNFEAIVNEGDTEPLEFMVEFFGGEPTEENKYGELLESLWLFASVAEANARELTITALDSNKSVVLFGEEYTDTYGFSTKVGNGSVTATMQLKSATPLKDMFDKLVVKRGNVVVYDLAEEETADTHRFTFGTDTYSTQELVDAFTIQYSFKESAVGKDAFEIEGVDENGNQIAKEQYPIEVVNHEGALVKYETLVANISDSDLATIEAQKPALDEAKTVARQAIDALEEGETKTAYNERFAVAENNQNEGYKLLYLYKSKNSHFSLSKVKNVGGNVPFKIVFDDENLVGDSTEALYYAPNSNVAVDVKSGLVPSQNYIAFGSATIADGEHIYINKVGDNYYRTVVEVEEGQIAKINGTEIDASKIAEQGGSYTVPGKEVSKSALTDALAEANALNDAHVVGTEVGQVPQNQKDAFNQAIAKAQEVADDDDATTAKVNKAVEALNKAKEEFDSFIVDYTVDKTALAKAISDYTAVVETATVGSNVGETTQDNIDALTAAIATAQSAMDAVDNSENYDAEDEYDEDVQAIADALQALEDAKAEFDKHVVSTASYADAKLKLYEEAASRFLDSIRKKIRI